ncbi:L-rhamnose mutarotase [Nocardioides bizhenqiangii]|uniref:L-rhamnose mutarotase n=1 Tax=Nocardioides bizhenqiangii TaxID=3095076 RepID=A0ABZ0ZRM3_9ACTN|nr:MULTISPECIES: L-rhamnose mutarotase [unclassified Nocardioides]MDZ5619709.1 L-rhamnose mutarotase [Nocardioides sp. HM23]WQQ26282.1 L-rhamnose mutarotase [Nocardioides sp. HM61]
MPRYCFTLQVRPDLIDEYVERHRAVWPEMLAALAETGWRNYSLFLREDGLLVGYVESDDLAAARAAMGRTEVNTRWQAEMAAYFTWPDAADAADDTAGQAPDEGFVVLREVFNLDDQLAESTRS